MKKLLLALTLLFAGTSFAAMTTSQKYKLNNWMGPVGLDVQLGTLIQNAENANAFADANLVKYVDVSISSAQMLALNTTPKTLVAAPGAGFAILPIELYSTITYNTTAYVCNAAGLILKYTDGSGTAPGSVLTQAFCQSSASALQNVKNSATAFLPTTNAALVLHAGSANPTTGDSVVNVRLYYRVVPNPLAP